MEPAEVDRYFATVRSAVPLRPLHTPVPEIREMALGSVVLEHITTKLTPLDWAEC